MYYHLRSLQRLSKTNIIEQYLSFRNMSGVIKINLSWNVMLVFGPVVSETSKDHGASTFRVKESISAFFLDFYTWIFSNTRVVTQSCMSGSMYESAKLNLMIRVLSLVSADEITVLDLLCDSIALLWRYEVTELRCKHRHLYHTLHCRAWYNQLSHGIRFVIQSMF